MKKALSTLFIVLGLTAPLAVASAAGAVNVFQNCSTGIAATTDVCKARNSGGNQDPFTHGIAVFLNILTFIVGVAAIGMMIFSGLKMLWAQGDPGMIKSAREGMIGALVGIAVAGVARVIVVFVLGKVG